jgi:response regulator RpfG family c-di-GMP phosphodiesterase
MATNNMSAPGDSQEAQFTLLCVDDDPSVLNALRRLLTIQGYRLFTAASGPEGLDILRNTPVDLVVSDMKMPGMNGAQFLEQVKVHSPDTIRILLTAYPDLHSTVTAINQAGIYRYIEKPWDNDVLLRILDDALQRKLLEREKAQLVLLTQQQNLELKELNANLESQVRARTAELRETLHALEQAHDKLKNNFLTSIKVFTNLIEQRGGTMLGHSRHVAEFGRQVASHMKLEDSEVQDVTLAGLLHAVGQLGIPDTLLRTPLNMLSSDERSAVMSHPIKGQAALMAVEQLAGAGKLIRSYREHYDGTGYPDRLSGSEIPLGARILSIAHDYYAALEGDLTGRPLSKPHARGQIIAGRGTRYDPAVVDAFLALVDEIAVRKVHERSVSPEDLREGMVLARDLVTPDGLLLLAKDCVLDTGLIDGLRRFELPRDTQMQVFVRTTPSFPPA